MSDFDCIGKQSTVEPLNSRHANSRKPGNSRIRAPELKGLFMQQEEERRKLRMKHIVEKEKLILSVEQVNFINREAAFRIAMYDIISCLVILP